jgi:DNA-binding transcriptional ArsR family regulator
MKDISYKQFFATLSGDSRLEIIEYLKQHGSRNVSEIAIGTGQEQSAVSHNLKSLHQCECVHVEVRGKSRYYSLNEETIVPLLELADQHIQKYCHADCQYCSSAPEQFTNPSRDV